MTSDFLAPERLWLLLVVAALGAGYVAVLRWRRRTQLRFTQVDLFDRIAPSRPGWRRHAVAGIQLLGLAAAVVAVARPVDRTTERLRSEGRIVLAVDVSLSMMATDVDPDRLTAAQQAARDFVDEVDDDVEVGLISFSGVVNVEVPPTLDRRRLDRAIDRLQLAEATAIGDALAVGTRVLTETDDDDATGTDDDSERAPGAIVLLTDGETTVGRPTTEGSDIAAEVGIPVFTIAFGTDEGTIRDPITGEIVPVPVAPEPLEAVAETTGGVAYEAATGSELAGAYDEIRASLGETLGEEIEIITELTWRWALAALVLLAVAWLLALWWLRGMV